MGVSRLVTGLVYILVTKYFLLSSLCVYAVTATLQAAVIFTLISKPSECMYNANPLFQPGNCINGLWLADPVTLLSPLPVENIITLVGIFTLVVKTLLHLQEFLHLWENITTLLVEYFKFSDACLAGLTCSGILGWVLYN